MPTLRIDGRTVEVEAGCTVLEAASRLGIEIPALCSLPGLAAETSCLVCVVRVESSGRLVPACATEAVEGMVVASESEDVRDARRTALELLLGDHLGDCLGPCQLTCPAQMNIPEMIRLIAAGRLADAAAVVKARIPLPAVLGRICPELCERACRRRDVDAPVAIRLLKQYVGDHDLASATPHAPGLPAPSGKRVAIVGAGPAGLSAAYYLRRAGHACTLLDEREYPGGRLRYGVPEEALSREVLAAEVASILRLGVNLQSNTQVGRDTSLAELREASDAVIVAAGDLTEAGAQALGLPVVGGRLEADRRSQMTAVEGVFAAGSVLTPSRHAVRAVGSGRTAAESVDRYLAEGTVAGAERPFNVRLSDLEGDELEAFAADASPRGRITPLAGEAGCFAPDEAQAEAGRCLNCDCAGLDSCRLRQWSARYGADPRRYREEPREFSRNATHPALVYEAGKCISCGLCVQLAGRAGEPYGLSYIGRGFTVRIGTPFGVSLAEALARAAGECAEACPTGALVLRRRT
ncbi:MAG: FAD-dependent oxidoreductase [Armatimonadetes bacterium]|nr:FAD-dependent oxidoreductase [Armatimonadota bacterium]